MIGMRRRRVTLSGLVVCEYAETTLPWVDLSQRRPSPEVFYEVPGGTRSIGRVLDAALVAFDLTTVDYLNAVVGCPVPEPSREVRPGQRYPVRRRMATYAESPIHDRILHPDPSEAVDLAELVDDVYDSLASLPEIDEP